MRIGYPWGPVEVLVQAQDGDSAYAVTLLSRDFSSTPMLIDTRWGADHAARIALDTYYRASVDPRRFVASERLDAGHMKRAEAERHVQWVRHVAEESSEFKGLLEEAWSLSRRGQVPLDISSEVQLYFELVDFGYEAAIAGLTGQGYSRGEAEAEFHRQSIRDSIRRWKLVPRLRSARSGLGAS